MPVKTCCVIPDQDLGYLDEIQKTQVAIELWAYGIETSPIMGTVAFEFAIYRDQCWYELYQRFITLEDEEYSKIHILKHNHDSSASASDFPFLPHERIYQSRPKGKELGWMKIATIYPPFSIYLYQDTICTCNEAQNGAKTFQYKCADVALDFESISSRVLLQITTHPYFMRLCNAEKELNTMKELWEFHFTEEEGIDYLRSKGSKEYFYSQRLIDYSRIRMHLSERISI